MARKKTSPEVYKFGGASLGDASAFLNAAEIVKRCDGQATVTAIVDDLVQAYSAPRDRVLADVSALLRQLADRRLLEL